MDARVTRETTTYRLVNRDTRKVEATGLGRVAVMDLQNRLWARGIKTTVEAEDPLALASNRQ